MNNLKNDSCYEIKIQFETVQYLNTNNINLKQFFSLLDNIILCMHYSNNNIIFLKFVVIGDAKLRI